jgi:hypothetical protein
MATKKTKVLHGGKRRGAGRKPMLANPTKVLVRFEARQLEAVDHYQAAQGLPTRNAALRSLVDATLLPEIDDA